MKPTVLICGGGNGAHVMTGIASSQNVTVRVMSIYSDEAERWQKIISNNDMQIVVQDLDTVKKTIRSRPTLITNDPQLAVPGANIIIITVPAFSHESYLKAIVPYLQNDTIIVGLPSQMGFEFQCADIFQEKFQSCALVSAESLPWACRIDEFGKKAIILGIKNSLACSVINFTNRTTKDIISCVQDLLGQFTTLYQLSSYMAVNLMAKAYVHPPIMFARWKDYDGIPLREKPAFYQGLDSVGAELLSRMSDEIFQTAHAIEKVKPDADMNKVTPLFKNFLKFYDGQIVDKTNLLSAFQTNKAYQGLVHPMKSTENNGFIPDFNHRYLREDVPFGLCVFRGIAEIVGMPTPAMDEMILWYQNLMGKEYLINGRLQGKDVIETRAPQRYGLRTLEQLFNLEK